MAKFIDLTNQKFGKLTVICRAPNKNGRTMWLCKCDCGNEVEVRSDQLRSGITKSCGCLHIEQAKQTGKRNFKDLTNQRFGKLIAIKPIFNNNKKRYDWLCKCDCGNTIITLSSSLINKNTQSCGCIKSIGESNIRQILQKNGINYISQYRVEIDNRLYIYDFAITEKDKIIRLIEFDGIQHYGRISGWFTEARSQELQISDNIKNVYALSHNIPLVRIPYWERDNITLEILLGDKYLITEEN